MNCLNKKNASRQRGGVIAKILLFIPLLVLLVFGFYEGRKAYWDYQVKEMCEKDGGVFIKQKIVITDAERKALGTVGGHVSIPPKSLADSNAPVLFVYKETVIHEPNPSVTRWDETIYRRSDDSVIATVKRFRRNGGDFPTFAHPSSFSCPDELELFRMREAIFQKQGE